MARHLDDEAALADLREYALTRGAQFSWPLVAAALLDACETVHAGHKAKVVSADRILLDATTALAARADREPSSTLALSDALDRSISPMQRQLLVDVSELAAHDHRTGIQRVTRAVVSEWMANPPAGYRIQLIRIDRASRQYVCANEYMGQLTGQQGQDGPLVCHAGDAFLGLDLVGDTASLIPHWFEYFRATGVSIAFVVYDILPVRHPEWWPLDGGRYHERWLRAVAEYSDRLICISAAVAEDVRSWMDQSLLERTLLVPPGGGHHRQHPKQRPAGRRSVHRAADKGRNQLPDGRHPGAAQRPRAGAGGLRTAVVGRRGRDVGHRGQARVAGG